MAAVPSALVLNPADPAHRGAEWIQRLEEHHRGLTDAEAGAQAVWALVDTQGSS